MQVSTKLTRTVGVSKMLGSCSVQQICSLEDLERVTDQV